MVFSLDFELVSFEKGLIVRRSKADRHHVLVQVVLEFGSVSVSWVGAECFE
jgi:hypothetical protein